MSRTAEDDRADGDEPGATRDATPAGEPDPEDSEESTETASGDPGSESESEYDPAARRCGITLGEQ